MVTHVLEYEVSAAWSVTTPLRLDLVIFTVDNATEAGLSHFQRIAELDFVIFQGDNATES